MLESVVQLALSMAIIHGAIWCLRVSVCYAKLRRVKRLENHIFECLCYSNLLLLHALQRDRSAAKKPIALRDTHRSKETNIGLGSFMDLGSSFFGENPKYKTPSGEILPYHQRMQSLHEEAGRLRGELSDLFEESEQRIDSDFLSWDYGTPFPELDEEYRETTTVWTYYTMQSKYFDFFDAIRGVVKSKHIKFQQLLSFFLLIPTANVWFQRRVRPPSREKTYKESSELQAEYKEHKRRTGGNLVDLSIVPESVAKIPPW